MRGVNEVFPWPNFAAFLSFLSWVGSCTITGAWQSLYLWYFSQVANISYPATRWFHGLHGNDTSFCVKPSWDSATLFCFILLKYEIIAEEVWQPAHCISQHTLLCYIAPHFHPNKKKYKKYSARRWYIKCPYSMKAGMKASFEMRAVQLMCRSSCRALTPSLHSQVPQAKEHACAKVHRKENILMVLRMCRCHCKLQLWSAVLFEAAKKMSH